MPTDLSPEAVEIPEEVVEAIRTKVYVAHQASAAHALRVAIDTGRVAVVPPPEERVERVARALIEQTTLPLGREAVFARTMLAALGLDGEARDGT